MQIISLFVLTNCSITFQIFYQLDAPILCYNEIVYCVERAHHESFFMGHGNAESGLEKLKET